MAELHANGLKVCAWQYVYGTNPAGEAELGARAVADGADCLVIDAESEYEGHYAAAQTYIADLRAKIGPAYPLGLASFPYVSYHPSFPYSVFLGPNGAQYNAPQMYWKDIGTSVDTVYANTYIANRIYGRPLFPLGQTYGGVSSAEVLRFREEAVDYGATGVSFWDWQETPTALWTTLAAPLAPLTSVTPNTSYPELRERQQRRSRAVDAGASGERDPGAGNHGHLQRPDGRQPAAASRPPTAIPASGVDERRHVGGAAGPPADRSRLDRRGTERLSASPQTRWISVPVPRPPPQHIVTKPISLSERSSSCRSVVIRRAPVEPSGCPSAIAPPLTLTRSMSGLCSRRQAATTGAKASLISNRSMSSIVMPLRSRILRVAGIGPSSIFTGSQPTVV